MKRLLLDDNSCFAQRPTSIDQSVCTGRTGSFVSKSATQRNGTSSSPRQRNLSTRRPLSAAGRDARTNTTGHSLTRRDRPNLFLPGSGTRAVFALARRSRHEKPWTLQSGHQMRPSVLSVDRTSSTMTCDFYRSSDINNFGQAPGTGTHVSARRGPIP